MSNSHDDSNTSGMQKFVLPNPSRPIIEKYGIPETMEGTLPWEFVVERMEKAKNYWLCTSGALNRPHAMPVWGIWLDNRFHFGGGYWTKKAKNIKVNPNIVIHLGDGEEAIIIEGTAEEIKNSEYFEKIDAQYEKKYNIRHGPPIWLVVYRKIFAWQKYPDTVTRWVF